MSSNYLENYILKRYTQGEEKNWNDIVNRVSQLYPPIKKYMENMDFIPGGRNLATVNTNHVLIPNCVVVDIEDDLSKIFETLTRLVELTRRGAGIGMNFGKLRPANTFTKKYEAHSCGPVAFLNMYSVVLKTIQQQSRHGAFIGIMPITHPDVLSFITVKQDLKKINNFNLSVLVDDELRLVFHHLLLRPELVFRQTTGLGLVIYRCVMPERIDVEPLSTEDLRNVEYDVERLPFLSRVDEDVCDGVGGVEIDSLERRLGAEGEGLVHGVVPVRTQSSGLETAWQF